MKVIRKKLIETVVPQYDWTTKDISKLNCTLITEDSNYAVYEIKDQAAASALGDWVPDWNFTDWNNWNTIKYRAMTVLVPRHKRDKYILAVDHVLFFLPKDPAVYSPYILCICRYGRGEQGLPTPFVFFNEDFRKLENNRIPSNKFPTVDYAGVHITSRRGDTGIYTIDNTLVHIGSEVRNLVVPSGIKEIDCALDAKDETSSIIRKSGPNDLRTITIPGSVKTIKEFSFANCALLTKVDIKNGLNTIEENAFLFCKKLTDITLPDSITAIKKMAFAQTGLVNVELPEYLTEIDPYVFYGSRLLKTVKLPSNLKSINERAFYECYSLESIEIPDTVNYIGPRAFASCPALAKVTLGSGLTVLDATAFIESGVQSIKIPRNVKQIGKFCFANNLLSELTLEDGIQSIDNFAFSNNQLTEIVIPDSVTYLGDSAFNNNKLLTKVVIGSGVTVLLSGAFQKCPALTEVKLGNNIELIGDSAFKDCTSLKTIILPDSLNEIGGRAFYNSGLTEITIPRNVSKVGLEVFENCQSLDKITFKSVLRIEQGIIAGINHPVDITFQCNKAQLLNARNVASIISNQAFSNGQVIHCLDGNVIW